VPHRAVSSKAAAAAMRLAERPSGGGAGPAEVGLRSALAKKRRPLATLALGVTLVSGSTVESGKGEIGRKVQDCGRSGEADGRRLRILREFSRRSNASSSNRARLRVWLSSVPAARAANVTAASPRRAVRAISLQGAAVCCAFADSTSSTCASACMV